MNSGELFLATSKLVNIPKFSETKVTMLSILEYQEQQTQWIGQIELRNRLLSA